MRRYYILSYLGEAGREIRQISFSRWMLWMVCGVLVLGMTAIPFLLSSYQALKENRQFHPADLEKISQTQKTEIQQQEIQLKYFASEMSKLKTALTGIKKFENHVRLIANIGEVDHKNSIFGIGGSIGGDSESILGAEDFYPGNGGKLFPENVDDEEKNGMKSAHAASLEIKMEQRPSLLASTPIIYPSIGWETSGFGYHRSPLTGNREFHKGLDISAAIGTPVVAPANGTITYAGSKGVWGITLIVEHGHGLVTRYSHLSGIIKPEGAQVKRGETIAHVGDSGKCIGPHLHYEVRLHGIPVNPQKYILFTPSYIHEAFVKESQKKG
ncbi:MAG: M23 family metallopeptidase [Pseudomonadota bacterium]